MSKMVKAVRWFFQDWKRRDYLALVSVLGIFIVGWYGVMPSIKNNFLVSLLFTIILSLAIYVPLLCCAVKEEVA